MNHQPQHGETATMANSELSITVGEHGPYQVDGSTRLVPRHIVKSGHGESMTWRTNDRLESASTMWLCRGGSSANKPRCAHAGFCSNRVTNVWKLARANATEDSIVRAQVMAMIERRPSGASSYAVGDEDELVEPELPAEIAIVDDGPLFVTGGIPVDRTDGQPVETRNRVVLCRCGQSVHKPLCDGSHVKAGSPIIEIQQFLW